MFPSRLSKSLNALILLSALDAHAAWMPISDVSLMVESGSILDFSEFTRAQRERATYLGKEGAQRGIDINSRYLMANLGFGVSQGGYPSHTITNLYIQELIKHGYNSVRLDFTEAILMEGRKNDFDFDPEQLDRFYYLLAQLGKHGIKYVLNGLSSDNGGYGNIKERWISNKHVTIGLYYSQESQNHWKTLMKRLFLPLNPYTGVALIHDPNLMGIIMVNESGIPFLTRKAPLPEFKPLMKEWLASKYGSYESIPNVWKRDGALQLDIPKVSDQPGQRMRDTQEFYLELEERTAKWMQEFFREIGYKGSLTIYNNWNSPGEHLARGSLDWVDMHNYFAHPAYLPDKIVVNQNSMLGTHAGYIRELAIARYMGKPFTVSEFGQVFWNPYRRESALAVPAYAAFQGWNAICQHSGPIHLSYASKNPKWDVIQPFGIGVDPIGRITETLGALLYLRGDVSPAKNNLVVNITPEILQTTSQMYGMPEDVTRLSLVTGVSLFKGSYQGSNAKLELGKPGITYNGKTYKSSDFVSSSIRKITDKVGHIGHNAAKVNFSKNQLWQSRFSELKFAGLVSLDNATDVSSSVYQSDTGEILLDAVKKKLQLISSKTEAIVFDSFEPVKLSNLEVVAADGPALFSVSSMDENSLKDSERMLVIIATDARNSEMKFADKAETMVLDIGKKPITMRTIEIQFRLKNTNKSALKVYSVNLRGQRMDQLPVKVTDNGIEVILNTNILTHGPTPYFEIVKQ